MLCEVERGRIVGLASSRTPAGTPARTVRLVQFHVDPAHWRAGLGTALHAACVERRRADRRHTAVLEVPAGNRRAREFCARQGWVRDPEHPAGSGDHHLALRYTVADDGE